MIKDRRAGGLGLSEVVDGRITLYGSGPVPCRIMLVGECPSERDISAGSIFSDDRGSFLRQSLKNVGVDSKDVYLTNFVKHRPKDGKIKAADVRASKELLQIELETVKPELIISAGNHALKELLGKKATLAAYRGMLIDMPESEAKVFPIYNPGYIFRMPEHKLAWDSDLAVLRRVIANKPSTVEPPDLTLIHSVEELQAFTAFVINTYDEPVLYIDCEWHGNNYMEEQAYIRTVQLGYDDNKVATVEFYDEEQNLIVTRAEGQRMLSHTDLSDEEKENIKTKMFQVLNVLLSHKRVKVRGHNVRADGRWLLWHGVDIRETTDYDTMVMEHTIDSRGPFGLSALTMKYTDIGRYDDDIEQWKAENQAKYKDGFGLVPSKILMPYGAFDVEAPRQIHKAQLEGLAPYVKTRGEYPSLAEADMSCARILYEMENEGLLVDKDQFNRIRSMYTESYTAVEAKLCTQSRIQQ